ncbi:hypothetical protein DMJ13_19690 [halophilic archaeon]|nr:hypothetical protein DMJ13_19690 [halophilic archaeon]
MSHEIINQRDETEASTPQNAVLASDAVSSDGGVYHFLNDAESGSVCGQLQKDDLFAGNPDEIVSRKKAEKRGLQPCHHCMTYTGER